MSLSKINVRFDSSKFRLGIWKRAKDKEEKDIRTKFTTIAPVHSRVSRGKKIMLSLTDKVKLLDFHKQKPKLGCHPLAELSRETCNIEIGKSKIARIIKNKSNILKWKFWRWYEKKDDSKVWHRKRCIVWMVHLMLPSRYLSWWIAGGGS